ncbi:hypothetical protein Bbelb_234140, partial [Branchiostoma belcheri]
MADDFAANSVPGVRPDDLSRGNMLPAIQNVGTVKSIFRLPDSDGNDCIQPYAIKYQDGGDDDHDDKSTKHDNNTCIQPYAVAYQEKDNNYAEKSSTFQTSPTDGEVQPYAVAYLHENVAFGLGEAKTDESFQRSEAATSSSNAISVNTAGQDSSEDDTDVLAGYDSNIHQNQRLLCPKLTYTRSNLSTDSMYNPNGVNRDTIYPQHAGNTSLIYRQYAMDQDLTYQQNAGKTNPIYPGNSNPVYPQNTMDTNSIFPQTTGNSNLMDEPNLVPESARSTDIYDKPCIQPYAAGCQTEEDDDEDKNKHRRCDNNACNQLHAVKYKEKDDDGNNELTKWEDTTSSQPYSVRNVYNSEEHDDNNIHTKRSIQPYAVKYQEKDDEDNDKRTERDGNPCIQPYSVRYQTQDDKDNGKHTDHKCSAVLVEHTSEISPTNVDIQPYAVKYMCQDDVAYMASSSEETQTKESSNKIKNVADCSNGSSNDDTDTSVFVGDNRNLRQVRHPLKTLHPNPTRAHVLNSNPTNAVLNALILNRMYAQNAQIRDQSNAQGALIPNQMHVANVRPQRADSCPTGYIAHDGAFYKVYNQSKTYDQAREQCAADGGLLAMPKNKQLDAFLFRLKNALVGPGYGYVWFGLSDEHREGEWKWADGTPHNITADWGNWVPNQPEGCAHYFGWISEGWNSMRCDFSNKFICQLAHDPAGSDEESRDEAPCGMTVDETGYKKWRDDGRCGPEFPLEDGSPAECDPDSVDPCCSPRNWCGKTIWHCDCWHCVDYSKKPATHPAGSDEESRDEAPCGMTSTVDETVCPGKLDGSDYRGNLSVTKSGRTCQRWDSNTPHFHHNYWPGTSGPGTDPDVAENYCRNPDSDETTLWCYTTDPSTRWEYCTDSNRSEQLAATTYTFVGRSQFTNALYRDQSTLQMTTDPPVKVGTDPPVKVGTDPPVKVGTDPPVKVGTDPPVKVGTDPPVKVGTDPPVKAGYKKWRKDWQCGRKFPLEDGSPAECNPDGVGPCCSPRNWCGKTSDHCHCRGCVDYRKKSAA